LHFCIDFSSTPVTSLTWAAERQTKLWFDEKTMEVHSPKAENPELFFK
jgi:hypothetical protein